jgi:hypothetical protein
MDINFSLLIMLIENASSHINKQCSLIDKETIQLC